jgi:hypothetical protein
MNSEIVYYTFTVDGSEFKSDQPFLPGIKIKLISKTDASHSLYLMESGQTPDIAVGDSDTVNVIGRSFFTTPRGLIHG